VGFHSVGIALVSTSKRYVEYNHDLADEADLSWSTIIRIEKGRIVANIDVLTSVARALQMPLWELLRLPEEGD
jgi:DNA-binding XRE family transcriptional regulator